MIKTVEKQIVVLEKEIKAVIVYTDCGINATVAGGDKSHIGSVAIVDEQGNLQSTTFPNHKETIIAESWAKSLYEKYHQPVVVSAGIHYDGITKSEIELIIKGCEELKEIILTFHI